MKIIDDVRNKIVSAVKPKPLGFTLTPPDLKGGARPVKYLPPPGYRPRQQQSWITGDRVGKSWWDRSRY
jgi:hypothetical protein